MAFLSRGKGGFSRPPDFDAIRDEFRAFILQCLAETKERTRPDSPADKWGEHPEWEIRGINFATDPSHKMDWRFTFFITTKNSGGS